MRKTLLALFIIISFLAKSQTTLHGDYKIIDIGGNGYGDYTRSVILLHEMYNGVDIDRNYAVGTITAMRGSMYALSRFNIVQVNTYSAYRQVAGSLVASDDDRYQNGVVWKLKTCLYNGKKYLAVEVPYGDSYHDWGFKFNGATSSTAENMKCVSYEVAGQPVNQSLISNIEDFNPGMIETHAVSQLNITGKVGIGIPNKSSDMLAVNGVIHSQSVRVDMKDWSDYVLHDDYKPRPLSEVKTFIDGNHHLPDVPSEKEVVESGLNLGEMNKLLLKKVEELTLYLIENEQKDNIQQEQINILKKKVEALSNPAGTTKGNEL
ncbi:hypothetical protein SAMN06265348_103269 [Pedobacter westerhofensis]|uniref:Uncharacterized protein n=1 Tax=Pedobacter westerhofensis TaxID=425512 RepID=A0A521C6P1_9SPHI|nr:hypothetical protein [Pedobacter westerhofensis]SMO55035.1 hypothetical protein SAMN06265348_103269 [Pedobacter westerhofensis]